MKVFESMGHCLKLCMKIKISLRDTLRGVFDNECICVHMFTHMNAYVCICLHVYAYVCMCTHVYAYVCIYQDLIKKRALRGVFDNECICVHIFTHMNAYVCTCTHVHAYVCIYQDLMLKKALRGVFDSILGAINS